MENKKMKKKFYTKFGFISGIKKFFKKIDKKMIFVVVAIVIFIMSYGIGSYSTHWMFDDSQSSDSVAVSKHGRIVDHKNKAIALSNEANGYVKNNKNNSDLDNFFGVGYQGQNMRDNLLVVLAIKSILLIILLAILFLLTNIILQNYKKVRKSKSTIHVVRQLSKTHKKAVKIKKTKRK